MWTTALHCFHLWSILNAVECARFSHKRRSRCRYERIEGVWGYTNARTTRRLAPTHILVETSCSISFVRSNSQSAFEAIFTLMSSGSNKRNSEHYILACLSRQTNPTFEGKGVCNVPIIWAKWPLFWGDTRTTDLTNTPEFPKHISLNQFVEGPTVPVHDAGSMHVQSCRTEPLTNLFEPHSVKSKAPTIRCNPTSPFATTVRVSDWIKTRTHSLVSTTQISKARGVRHRIYYPQSKSVHTLPHQRWISCSLYEVRFKSQQIHWKPNTLKYWLKNPTEIGVNIR